VAPLCWVRADVLQFHAIELEGLAGIVLDHDQHGQNPVLVRIELAEGVLDSITRVVRGRGYGDALARLAMRVGSGGGGPEKRVLVRGERRGYNS